jgi:TolA-binding protein
MRLVVALSPVLLVAALGCGRSEPTSAESPAQAAARIFNVAQNLEQQRKTKEAFAAYRQIARLYPNTPHGQRAAERIMQAQKAALRKAK